MKQNQVFLILFLAVLVFVVWQIPKLKAEHEKTRRMVYSEFIQAVREGQVQEVTLYRQEGARGLLKPDSAGKGEPVPFVADIPTTPGLADQILSLDPTVKVSVKAGVWGEKVIGIAGSFLVPLLFVAVFWLFIVRQMQTQGGQALSFGRSRHKMWADSFERVTFDDVAGMEGVKEEVREIVDFLKDPEKFRALGAKIPRGVLLLGPPGCGKTLLARAIAGEAGVAFFYISGSDFVEMFVGVGASRVRDLFEQAKHNLPAIVFIDEIDAVGRLRGAGLGGGHDEREQTLNALLVEMDGFDPNADVILLAATNRPDVLDPALLRPGRFDRRIVVHSPDVRERRAIVEYYLKDKPLEGEVDAETLARRSVGFTGADIENLVNEAAILAARRNKTAIGMSEFNEAVERVIAGPERRSRVISETERKILAYHEAGHALVGNMLPDFEPTYKVTILPRGMALGYTMRLPQDDKYVMSRGDIVKHMIELLGGRASEDLVFGDATTGAADDLSRASELARRMVCEFGMSAELGAVTYGKRHGPVFLARDMFEERNYGEDVAKKIDEEVRDLVDAAKAQARTILEEHRGPLESLVRVLLERETLDKEEVEAVIATGELPPALPEPAAAKAPPEAGAPKATQTSKERRKAVGPPMPDPSAS